MLNNDDKIRYEFANKAVSKLNVIYHTYILKCVESCDNEIKYAR